MKQPICLTLLLLLFCAAIPVRGQSIQIIASAPEYCAGKPVTITAVASNAGAGATYQWMLNSEPYAIGNSLVFSSDTLRQGDLVQCLLLPGPDAADKTPVASNTILLVIHPLPVVDLFPGDTLIKVGNVVPFRVFVAGHTGDGMWTPAHKMQEQQLSAPVTVALYQSIDVMLEVSSNKGCKSSATSHVVVTKPMVMPNGFTPNGDGVNDVFRIPVGIVFELREFAIYDRWGAQVFFTRHISNGWDGTFRGVKVVAGDYVYAISGKNKDGPFVLKGWFSLFR